MSNRDKLPSFVSPPGRFVFPTLNTPDEKYGHFGVRLHLDKSDEVVQAFIEALSAHYEAAIAAGEEAYSALTKAQQRSKGPMKAAPLYHEVYDADDNETGVVEFRFRMPSEIEFKRGPKAGQKIALTPDLFDAQKTKIPHADAPQIWSGTVGRVSFEVSSYVKNTDSFGAGLSLRMKAVQILDLVEGGSRTAEHYGFDEDDGYGFDGGAPSGSNAEMADADGDF